MMLDVATEVSSWLAFLGGTEYRCLVMITKITRKCTCTGTITQKAFLLSRGILALPYCLLVSGLYCRSCYCSGSLFCIGYFYCRNAYTSLWYQETTGSRVRRQADLGGSWICRINTGRWVSRHHTPTHRTARSGQEVRRWRLLVVLVDSQWSWGQLLPYCPFSGVNEKLGQTQWSFPAKSKEPESRRRPEMGYHEDDNWNIRTNMSI